MTHSRPASLLAEVRRCRRVRRVGVGAVLALASMPGTAALDRCDFADGTRRLIEHDLALRFAATVQRCEAVATVPQAAPPCMGPVAPEVTGVRVIVARTETGRVSMSRPADLDEVTGVRVIVARTETGRVSMNRPAGLDEMIDDAAQRHDLDARLLHAVVLVESGYNMAAVSPKGAIGLMQVMPATGRRFGVGPSELADPKVNLDVGARYLRLLMQTFAGRLDLPLAAYNAGEGAVLRHGLRVPPFAETENYVRKVLAGYEAAGGR